MRKNLRHLLTAACASLTAFSLIGCSAAYKSESTAYDTGDYYIAETTAASPNYISSNGGYAMEVAEEERYITEGVYDKAESPASIEDTVSYGDKLVYTCSLTIETTEFDATVNAVKAQINAVGGFISSEETTDDAYNWYYDGYKKTCGTMRQYITVRVPADKYNEFLESVEGNGRITSRNMTAENITKQYRETETSIKSLEIQEERLLEMMADCTTIEDMITVEARLSEVQSELEYYRNSLSGMDMDVSYSTVHMSIIEVLEYKPQTEPEYTLTFGDRLKNTLRNSWTGFLDFLEGLLFGIIEAGPILLVLVIIIGGIAFIIIKAVKRIRRKKVAGKTTKVTPVNTEFQANETEKKNE